MFCNNTLQPTIYHSQVQTGFALVHHEQWRTQELHNLTSFPLGTETAENNLDK